MVCPEAALEMPQFVFETEEALDPDPAHSDHVAALALKLFDSLAPVHGYGPAERRLLEIAARLHDVGWSQSSGAGHHKISARIIRRAGIPGLCGRDRDLCALIARYHTKSVPDASRHRRFAELDADRQDLVEWLAGILRVADALDSGHERAVKALSCEVGKKTINIRIETAANGCKKELARAAQKHSLLVKKADRAIEYLC